MIRRVICVSGFVLAVAGMAAAPKCDVLPKAGNVVPVPPYADGKSCTVDPASPEKVQYQATNGDQPLFSAMTRQAELADGALYDEGSELYVAPEPDYVPTGESVEEPEMSSGADGH